MTFALLLWPGTEPARSPRCACTCQWRCGEVLFIGLFTVVISRQLSLGWFCPLEEGGLIFFYKLFCVASVFNHSFCIIFSLNKHSKAWHEIPTILWSITNSLWSPPVTPVLPQALAFVLTALQRSLKAVLFSGPSSLPPDFHHHILISWLFLLALRKSFPLASPLPVLWGWARSQRLSVPGNRE